MKTEQVGKHALSFVVIAVLITLAIGSVDTEESTQNVQSQVPAYTVSANALYNEYEDNEVAASDKYDGKVIIVTGTIQDIGKDIVDQAYVILGGTGALNGVQCMFIESQNTSIANLSKGQHVRVKGEVSGKMGNIIMRNCAIE